MTWSDLTLKMREKNIISFPSNSLKLNYSMLKGGSFIMQNFKQYLSRI